VNIQPLYEIRLRTPRLELRLPTHGELLELQKVAQAGIHPPEFMPFRIAWTDEHEADDFVVGFIEHQLRQWRPDAWALHLGIWAEGRLAGIQDLNARDFVKRRTVETGSWLGMGHQRRGYGTEMRTAVLELAFRGLGAVAAESGYVDGNDASRRVSEKLGYSVVGRGEVSPRGKPIGETQVEIRREDWRAPFCVEIEGLEPALPLFGL
jgi:RimJ/RimL family protein N-acetyltransferase